MILLAIRSNYLVNCYTYNNLKNGHLEKKISNVLANSNVKKCKISFVINILELKQNQNVCGKFLFILTGRCKATKPDYGTIN